MTFIVKFSWRYDALLCIDDNLGDETQFVTYCGDTFCLAEALGGTLVVLVFFIIKIVPIIL